MSHAQIARRVVVFGLGGTIAMSAGPSRSVVPSLTVEELLAAVPGLDASDFDLEYVDFRQVPGASLTFSDIADLAKEIVERGAEVDGMVVTQGTDTVEETAYLLDLLHSGAQPIVLTGAMRNPTLAGADGPANLLGAIRTAASLGARNRGCLVVFNDEIHAARRVRKTHTASVATFQSPDGGPLGYLVEGRPRFLNRIEDRVVVPVAPRDEHRVLLYTIALGDDGAVLDDMANHIDGLVIAALGAGHVPARMVPTLERVADRMPVVLTSRTGAGSVLENTYGFPGSETDLIARGLIPAGYLNSVKSRLLTAALLATGCDHATIRTAFGVAGGTTPIEHWPWPSDSSKDS
ncbi:asparaginase [Nocardia sp. NPDC004068]|uniref:asparaginase n=1 Tax=Nocardia sp. NPDC004068 TaxID=3364303 RepID=UPI0036CF31AD